MRYPQSQLADVTVDGRGTTKHETHVCDPCNVPFAEVTIEDEAGALIRFMFVTSAP